MSRLLAEYPTDGIIELAGSNFSRRSPQDGRLACRHLIFPATNKTGRWGLGRLKVLVDYLAIPVLCLVAVWVIMREGIQVILSVAHGHFFLAAALVSSLTSRPMVLAVHDDWVAMSWRGFIPWKPLYQAVFRWALRRAIHVYAIGPYMQEWLQKEYGVIAELQAPAVLATELSDPMVSPASNDKCTRIVYTGSFLGTTADGLELLLESLQGGFLEQRRIEAWELHIYTNLSASESNQMSQRWNDPRIHFHGWVSQDQLPGILAEADILFLPHSFNRTTEAVVRTSLPTKTADYLASGRPILVLAPPYSSLNRYAKAHGFAEVVEQPAPDALAEGIMRIIRSVAYREELCHQARKTFQLNHDLQYQRESFCERISRIAAKVR